MNGRKDNFMESLMKGLAEIMEMLINALVSLSNAGCIKIILVAFFTFVIGCFIAYLFPGVAEFFEMIRTIDQPDAETTICRANSTKKTDICPTIHDLYLKMPLQMPEHFSEIKEKKLSIVFIKPLNNKRNPKYEATLSEIRMDNISDDFYAYLFEYLQMRFTNWYLNIDRFGEKNEEIYRQTVLVMPQLQAVYDELAVIFADYGSRITPEIEQKIRDRMYIICTTIDAASAMVFKLANEEAEKEKTKAEVLAQFKREEEILKQQSYERQVEKPFEQLEVLNSLNTDAELEQLSYFYGKGEKDAHDEQSCNDKICAKRN